MTALGAGKARLPGPVLRAVENVLFALGLPVLTVVLWGSLAGSLFPLLLKRLGADPATSSAPFVATMVDVTGLIIYFGLASLLLTGSLL